MAIVMSKDAPDSAPRPWPNSKPPPEKWRKGLTPDQAALTDSAMMIPEQRKEDDDKLA